LIDPGLGLQITFEHAAPVIRIGREPDCELPRNSIPLSSHSSSR